MPSALLDFGLTLVGEAQPRDRFHGLLLLRKELGQLAAGSFPNRKLTFPRYDFACIWYLHSKVLEALDTYRLSIEAYDAVLVRDPDLIQALNNKGNTCLKYGLLCAQQN